jgi:hypothetical protein
MSDRNPGGSGVGSKAALVLSEQFFFAAGALRRVAEKLELEQVKRARGAGWSWREIALALNLSKQAVHHKYAHQVSETTRT